VKVSSLEFLLLKIASQLKNDKEISPDTLKVFLELLVKLSFEKENYPNELKIKEFELLEAWSRAADISVPLSPFIIPRFET
jgi:hypothetical protein